MRPLFSSSLVVTCAGLSLVALGSGGCTVRDRCAPPAFSSYTPSDAVYAIQPNAGADTGGSNPLYAITSDGQGTYRLAWTDPLNAATCFNGLVTIQTAFQTPPVGLSGHENIVLNQNNQLAFASIPGDTLDGVDFYADLDIVDIEAYVDSGTSTDIFFTDNTTGLASTTGTNVASFQSP